MAILRSLRDSSSGHWLDAFQWLCWNVICGLMPIWLPIIFRYLFEQKISINIITEHGEFALYSASFLGTALYLVLRDVRARAFPDRPIITPILIILLLISTAFYAAPMVAGLFSKIGISEPVNLLNKGKLTYHTLILISIVIITTFIIVVVDLVRSEPNITEMQDEQFNIFVQQFDDIQGE
jgi:hypothetical protein